MKKGAIIVGMWAKKARALVAPDLICLTSVNLAINSIDYLTYYRYIGDSSKTQLNVWLASINATVCFLALLVFLLSYLFPSKAKLLRIIGIAMLTEISLGYLAAGIIDFSTGYSIDGAWDLAIWCIWVGMVFAPLYRECEREKEAPTIASFSIVPSFRKNWQGPRRFVSHSDPKASNFLIRKPWRLF